MSPLSPLAQPSKGKPNVRLFVVSIIALHAVFFGGLLLQGCKKQGDTGSLAGGGASANSLTNDLAPLVNTNQPPFGADTNQGGLVGSPFGQPPGQPQVPNPNAPVNPGFGAPVPPPIEPLQPLVTTGTTEYVIKAGDTPAKVAKAHGVQLNALMQANPGLEPRKLKVGQKIQIPATAAKHDGASAAPAATGEVKAESAKIHVVKTGDTLTKIAKAEGLTIKELRAANNLKTDRINVGQKLKVPAGKASTQPAAGSAATTTTTAAAPTLPPATPPGAVGSGTAPR